MDTGAAVIVMVTFGDIDEARRIAAILLEERLVACVNLLPKIESIYRWKGSVESAEETCGILKTTRDRLTDLESRYLSLHSYETPEFLVLRVDGGSSGYLSWLAGNVLSR